jgi:hypothetical protein
MAKRNTVDGKKLLQMIKEGVEQAEIMEQLGIKTSTQLKTAYANALMETGQAPTIKGAGKKAKKKPMNMKISVNKRGSLVVPRKMIESMGIKIGEPFEAKKTPSGIQLKKVVEKS